MADIGELKYKISGVAVVQNEEKYIARMLQSVMPLVDEMIVIDGGSIDDTVKICEEEGALVVPRAFTGHFGDFRNEAVMLTKYPWILMLDADEILDDEFKRILPELVKSEKYDVFSLVRKNIFEDGTEDDTKGKDYQLRLFRRYCRWIYPVHEELVGWKNCKKLDCGIIHIKDRYRHSLRNLEYDIIAKTKVFDLPYSNK